MTIPALSIKGLEKIYANGFQALKGIDLTVQQGDFFALLGPNGAGKSTTIGIVTTLVKKTAGEIKIFGYDLDKENYQAKSQVGVVPQEINFNIFEKPKDILINQAGFYGIARKTAESRADYYLDKMELTDKKGLSSMQLSGGMKRRLMIARAMMNEPKLLILDEPTAGVDLEIRRSMWEFIKEINEEQGVTIILTTHYLEEAEQLCKNIAIIDKGRVVEQTDMKSLLKRLDVETVILDTVGDLNDVAVPDYQITVLDDNTLSVEIENKLGLTQLFAELDRQGVSVKSMRNKANRLEELFLRVVKQG